MKRKKLALDADIAQTAAEWVATLVDSPSRRTTAAARRWLRQSPEHCSEFLVAVGLYRLLKRIGPTRATDVEKLIAQLDTVVAFAGRPASVPAAENAQGTRRPTAATVMSSQTVAASITRRTYRGAHLFKVALIVFVSILAGLGGGPSHSDSHREYVAGSEPKIISLGLGTVIYLNAGSALVVTRSPRALSVTLDRGEALFDVNHQHGSSQQLWVFSAGIRLKDIGTRFDVQRRNDGILVSVLQGRVRIDGTVESIMADAGHEIDIHMMPHPQTHVVARADTELQRRTAWAYGWLDFTGVSLSRAALQFSERGRPIVVTTPSVADLQVGGRFRANDFEGWLATLPYLDVCVKRSAQPNGPDRVVLSRARVQADASAHGDGVHNRCD